MDSYDGMERYQIEDLARELAAQCRCYGYNGPCRFCNRLEKVHRHLDKLDVEEQMIKEIAVWVAHPKFKQMTAREFVDAFSYGLTTREWKKKDAT